MVVYSECQNEISCLLKLHNFISVYAKERTCEKEEEIQTEKEHAKDRTE